VTSGKLDRLFAFDEPVRTGNDAGGSRSGWNELFKAWAEVRYVRGGESAQAGGLSVAATFKIRVRSTANTRALTGAHTMRDPQDETRFNIREIDALSDRAYVWLVVQAGVAD
jgi:head-tail adaptor